MTFDEYQKIDAVNATGLKLFAKSPAQYRANPNGDGGSSSAFDAGHAAHTAVLEPDRFPLEFAVYDGGRRQGGDWERFKAANAGRTILKAEEYDEAIAQKNAVRSNHEAMKLLAAGEAERTIEWTDELTGLRCKGRIDWLSTSEPAIVDLKTTRSLDWHDMESDAERFGYWLSMAHYRAGVRAVLGVELPCVLVWVEKARPYEVCVAPMDEDSLYSADEERKDLLLRVKECRDKKEWPPRYVARRTIKRPAWYWKRLEQMQTQDPDWISDGNGQEAA